MTQAPIGVPPIPRVDFQKAIQELDRMAESIATAVKTEPLKVYVWRGGQVLKYFGSGLVVVAARSEEDAWAKLKAENIWAWNKLRHGNMATSIDTEAEYEMWKDDEDYAEEGWVVPTPEVFTLADLPALVMRGSD